MSPFAASILAALQGLPVFREDVTLKEEKRAQLEIIAPAIAEASRGDRFIAALLVAIGNSETHWSLRIWRNECHALECDRGRARGLWQNHRSNLMSDNQWIALGCATPEGTLTSAKFAAQTLRYGVHVCGQDAACVIRVYAGRGQLSQWAGLNERLNTFNLIRNRI